MKLRSEVVREGAVLSTQVSGSRYFFRELTGTSRAGVFAAYGGYERCDPDYAVTRGSFAFPTIELVIGGRGTVAYQGELKPLRAGTLLHYDRGAPMEIRADPVDPMAKYFLCLTGGGARKRLRRAGLRPNAVVQLAMVTEVQSVLEDLIREGRHHRATTERVCAALVELLLLKIEEFAGASQNGQAAEANYLRCKAVIEADAARLTTLREVAKTVGMEESQLCRLFRRYQRLSPYQYLLHRKMALAAERLMEPGARVKEAAAQVGFSDPYHFSRCFKKVHHVAPKIFQRSLQQR